MTSKNKWKVGGKRSDASLVTDPVTGAAVKTLDACSDLKVYKGTEHPIHSRMSSAETDVPIAPLSNSALEESRRRVSNYCTFTKSKVSTNVGVRRVVGNQDPLGASRPQTEQRISKARMVARDKGLLNNNNKGNNGAGHGHHGSSRSSVKWDLPERYKMVDIVGSGSYGQVCRAYDTEMQRYVAVKRIHKVFEDLIDCKRILREIAILGRLDHPNVVKILDICIPTNLENFDILYVVLEIAASDIKLLIRSPAFLTENHIRLLVYNLLNGVNYLHSVGIFHRDLKPANCLFNRDCSVKICDFGLARTAMAATASLTSVNNTNSCDGNKCDVLTHASTADTVITNRTNTLTGRSVYREGEAATVDYYTNTQDKIRTGGANVHKQQREQEKVKDGEDAYIRQLTGHVVTRWYRAPELILLKTDYNGAIDVWSIGCIFAELLNMMRSNVAEVSERSPLFPGSCCFPLSPDNKQGVNKEHQRENDQLNVIFNVLGTPSQEDVDAIASVQVRRYVQLFKRRRGIDLTSKFKGASAEAIDLLKRMLTFNPDVRISCMEAMQHDFFKQCFHSRHLIVPTEHVQLPFDDWVNMTEGQLRFSILREIQRYHPEFRIPFNIIYRP